ncbi:MAG: hypothetical protein GY943_18570 [Chloroflexi bacterium]|nr:hypothetical protein [Chloroflexota bacterium]
MEAIIELSKLVLKEGRKIHGNKANVNVGVSTFIPKPHPPFQWEPMDPLENVYEKLRLLKREIRGAGMRLRWNDALESIFEGFLSRGDRRMAEVVALAWQKGAKFDAWHEHYSDAAWRGAMVEVGLDPAFYTHRKRTVDEIFPWEHIDIAVTKKFLTQDYLMSKAQETRMDCRDQCFTCGILPKLKDLRRDTAVSDWKCPPVKRRKNQKPIPQHVPTVEGISLTVIQ